jgi:ubiquinone/menaquinone biosynthesis C-methylase UbiE
MLLFKLIPSRVFSAQARKPSGFFGRYVMTKIFNTGNADLNAFVKQQLELKRQDHVLEIGFGPGKLINEMAELTVDGVVEGIDFSPTMLKQAARVNKLHIQKQRVRLHQGDCTTLPFADAAFDKICSVNTLYFWKQPQSNLSEIFRVIRPGGRVIIGFRDDVQMSNLGLSDEIFSYYSQHAVMNLLAATGFSEVSIQQKPGVPFTSYCAVGYKS